ncbi:DUF397 domain-containing protein [Streptomyces sp. NPDC058773]|uniref:DUF397 domain-containing protein n=1 Tax=Streptomyces sp. NPDC058773 TaxID=3346632 RepID=UPI00369EAAB8
MASRSLDLSAACWRKSSYSNGDGGECLEVADGFPGLVVAARDSKVPEGSALIVRAGAWSRFVTAVKADSLGA